MSLHIINPSRKIVRDLAVNHVDQEKNHDCVTWKLKNFSSISTEKENCLSPVFTVGTVDECKWYLDFQPVCPTAYGMLFTFHLILDHESDCKEALVKLNFLFFEGNNVSIFSTDQWVHSCNDELKAGRNCKFITKSESEKKSGIGFTLNKTLAENTLIIRCEIMVQSVDPEIGNLSSNLESLLKNQLFTDVVLSVGGKKFPAHRTILAARSSVFAAMFTHDMVEKEGGAVRIEDIDENVFEEMLRYIYTGKLTFKSRVLAQKLLAAAHKYDMKDLLEMCEKILNENLSCSNALDVLIFAKLFDCKELKSEIVDFILDNKMQIMDTEAWKRLPEQDPDLLQEICEASFRLKN